MRIRIRRFKNKDLQSLVSLLNETFKNSYEFSHYTEENLNSWIQEANLKILVAEEKSEILGSAAYNDGHWGEEIEWLAVMENPNRKTIENKLVEKIEKYVKQKTVFTAVDAGSPKISEWTERGYKAEGGLYHMTADIHGVEPLPAVPDGIIIRCLRHNEEKEFVEVVNAGFGWERTKLGVIQKWKAEYPNFTEEWIHVAEIANKIVSVVVAKPDTRYNKVFNQRRGYLGPAATLPEFRGKNIASALTRNAMNFLYERGMNSAALYTSEQNISSVTLLKKLGFTIGHHWKFMRKTIS